MNIVLHSPYHITCECGWVYDSSYEMSKEGAQNIARLHLRQEHQDISQEVAPSKFEKMEEIPELEKMEEIELLGNDVLIRMEALRLGVESFGGRSFIRHKLNERVKDFESYIRTGKFLDRPQVFIDNSQK